MYFGQSDSLPYLDLIRSQIGHDLLRNPIDFILHPLDDMRVGGIVLQ